MFFSQNEKRGKLCFLFCTMEGRTFSSENGGGCGALKLIYGSMKLYRTIIIFNFGNKKIKQEKRGKEKVRFLIFFLNKNKEDGVNLDTYIFKCRFEGEL